MFQKVIDRAQRVIIALTVGAAIVFIGYFAVCMFIGM
jgi:predicted secreted protein